MIACGRTLESEEGTDVKHKNVATAGKRTTTDTPLPSPSASSSQPAAVAVAVEEEGTERPAAIITGKRMLVEDLEYERSPSSVLESRNVVIVMDALKEFSTEALEWALAHIIKPGSVVTLIGAMPWLNFIS
ncbi:hypothetical protein ACLOJK_008382 [Asimina triloba]